MAGTTLLGGVLGNMTVVVIGLCSRIAFLVVAVASHGLSVVAMAQTIHWKQKSRMGVR